MQHASVQRVPYLRRLFPQYVRDSVHTTSRRGHVFAALLFSCVLVSAGDPPPTMAVYIPCGDADGSGMVMPTDALAALYGAVGLASACDRNCDCDVDCDRELTVDDALAILHGSAKRETLACCFVDYCFDDDDCGPGEQCGTDLNWECDWACLSE